MRSRMEQVREIYEQLDKLLDELEKIEYSWKSTVYVLERLEETYSFPGREGMEMIAVWIKDYMKDMDGQLRSVLNRMDDQVMKLNK